MNRSSAPKLGLSKDDRCSWATRLYCLCAPAIVAGVLLVIWNRMLPQLLRGHLEKIVLSEQTSCSTHVQDPGQRSDPLASDKAATRLPSPEKDRCLWEVSRKLVDRRLSSESRLPGPSAQGPGDRRYNMRPQGLWLHIVPVD